MQLNSQASAGLMESSIHGNDELPNCVNAHRVPEMNKYGAGPLDESIRSFYIAAADHD
jgi:hypothetical protein